MTSFSNSITISKNDFSEVKDWLQERNLHNLADYISLSSGNNLLFSFRNENDAMHFKLMFHSG